jgi:hypothetical protein
MQEPIGVGKPLFIYQLVIGCLIIFFKNKSSIDGSCRFQNVADVASYSVVADLLEILAIDTSC